MRILLAPFEALLRLIRPTRGLHNAPWFDRPERQARVRPYVLRSERRRYAERLVVAAHATAWTREAVADARADRAELVGSAR